MRLAPPSDAASTAPVPTLVADFAGRFAPATRRLARLGWIVASPLWVMGCSVSAASEDTAVAESEIYGGAPDVGGTSAVVAIKVAGRASGDLCSGALVAENVVLTARHCVAKMATDAVVCDEDGKSRNGRHVAGALDPASLAIHLGSAVDFRRAPAARGVAIVEPEGDALCSADIALVVLDRAIADVKPLAVRVAGGPAVGETLRSVGYGKTDAVVPVGTRMNRAAVPVLAVGSGVSASRTPLGPREFEVGLSACHGDSGGPALSEETGAIVGVVSRGSDCEADFGHVYTTTFGFAALIAQAAERAGTPVLDESGHAVHADADAPFHAARVDEASVPASEDGAAAARAGGCTTSPARRGGSAPSAVALGLALCAASALARRRRAAPRPR